MDTRLAFFTEWYHRENERHLSLNESISIPTGIITAISIAYYFLISEFRFGTELDILNEYLFLGLLSASVIPWTISVYNLFGAYNNFYTGFIYKGLNYPTLLNDYYRQLQSYDTNYQQMYNDNLLKEISDALEENIKNNDTKSGYLHLAKRFLLITLLPLLVSLGPFIYNFFTVDKEPYQIIIKNQQLYQTKMAKQTSKPKPAPKPPGLRSIKEGAQVPSTKGGKK